MPAPPKLGSRSWHCNIKPALSISILNRNRTSLCLLRTLLPRVMTATEARRGLILLPIKCSCSARAYNRGSIPTPIPDLPGIGGPSPSPSPIRRGSGVHSHPHPRFAGDRGSSPSPVPIGGFVPWILRSDSSKKVKNLQMEADRLELIARHKFAPSNRPRLFARPVRVQIVLGARLYPAWFTHGRWPVPFRAAGLRGRRNRR